MIVVVAAAGGVGKGTLVSRLVERDPRLWLSRSWTTRPRRPGEAADAYTFVSRQEFLDRVEADGFLEHAEVAGNLYGTPWPEVPGDRDLLLEIDAQGAHQIRDRHPDALVVLLVPPSREAQEERLRRRGDDEDHIQRRLALAPEEERSGQAVADHVVVNDDLERAVDEVATLLAARRL